VDEEIKKLQFNKKIMMDMKMLKIKMRTIQIKKDMN
jgi:hypothetical protein